MPAGRPAAGPRRSPTWLPPQSRDRRTSTAGLLLTAPDPSGISLLLAELSNRPEFVDPEQAAAELADMLVPTVTAPPSGGTAGTLAGDPVAGWMLPAER